MMQCMPVRGTPQTWDQSTTQLNDFPWGSGMQPGNTHEEGMFPPNDFEWFFSNVNCEQNLSPQTYGEQGETNSLGYMESNAATIYPSFIPTPLQPAMGTGFLPLGEPPSEGGRLSSMSSCESKEVDMDLPMRFQGLQVESPMPSTSNSAGGLGEPKKPRKKEEGGVCCQCNQRFSRKSDVRRHENTAHGREIHACPQCNIICSRRDALQRHIRDQHWG